MPEICYLWDGGCILMYTKLMTNNNYDIVILGGGPSGLTAAIYTARAQLKTLVFAGNPPGGQLTTTTEVENFPGFPEGIQGPELINNMTEQAKRFDVEVINQNAKKLTGTADTGFVVTADNDNTYTAKSVIIATGASAKWLGLESEQRLRGKGVSACATCDGFFFKDKVVAVVGGGDASMEEATFLTRYCKKVYLIIRSSPNNLRASKIMIQRALDNEKVEFVYNSEVKEVLGEDSVTGLKIINNTNNNESELEVQGLFLAIGHTPNTKFLSGFLDLEGPGYIKVNNNTKTSVEGVFVGGDVADFRYRQAVTAAGLGCMAALDAEKFLSERGVAVAGRGY